ncbi:hypothetical protein HAX54_016797 [Datura stramonium]|uniref:WAT1-related protein n=1 Tax=Datura stramonium TaxID=4076 RepID=A0ABS8ULH2_DATST|nr:hypothetical protein [Datura stramonium]
MGKDVLPFLLMVMVQVGYAGTAIISKLVMDEGMDPYVHLSYRQIFATISIAPFAYFSRESFGSIVTIDSMVFVGEEKEVDCVTVHAKEEVHKENNSVLGIKEINLNLPLIDEESEKYRVVKDHHEDVFRAGYVNFYP